MASRTRSICAAPANISRADFHRPDAALQIEFRGQCYARELGLRNARQKGARVDVDGMSARRLHNRHASCRDVLAQVSGGRNAIAQVVLFQRLLQPNGDGLEIAPRQSPVGRVTLRQNEQVLFLLREQIIVRAEKSADVGHAVFFADMVQPSPSANISCAISFGDFSA